MGFNDKTEMNENLNNIHSTGLKTGVYTKLQNLKKNQNFIMVKNCFFFLNKSH